MSLTRAAGDLRQHDTSLAKSRDVASTPLSGCRESKAPCTLHVALGRTESGRLQHVSEFAALEAFRGQKRGPQRPQVRDLIQQGPQDLQQCQILSRDFLSYLLNSHGCTSKSPRLHKARAF